ncbi:hypothetical protein K2173_013114 [Erythroxylum novogranatense]|uniref:Uncharacterized protein n=1 Tax=Erythroxylum novogranatense TaxID=1862640 RepID=A0AAV8S6L5_9ROSI|nr:hypothetical protein K2173_013114 [Erythroxylum novogranatense]
MEGDPHPGAAFGRMSFGSFNPSVDKLNENATNLDSPEASANATGFSSQTGDASFTDNGSSLDGAESPGAAKPKSESNGDHKRKQSEMLSVPDNQHKSPKISQVGLQSSSCSSKGSFKQQKREKLDWSILRPKSEKKE